MLQQITKNMVSLAFLQILAKVCILIFMIIITPALGPELMGVYGYLLNLIIIFDIVIDYGMMPYMVKAIANNRENSRAYFFHPLVIKYSLAIVSSIAIMLYGYTIEPDPIKRNAYDTVIMILFTWPLFNSVITIFQAYERQDLYGFIYVIRNGVLIIITYFLLMFGLKVEAPLFGYAFSALTAALVGVFWLRKRFFLPYAKETAVTHSVKTIARQGFPFFITALIICLYTRIDVIVLSWLRGNVETGLFKTSQQTLEGLAIVNFVVGNTIYPVLSRIASTNNNHFDTILKKSIKLLFLLCFPAAVLFTTAGRELIGLFYGIEQFSGSVIALQILVWQYIPYSINYVNLYTLYALNLQKKVVIVNSAGLIIKTVIFVLFSLKAGYVGGCWAVVISECLMVFIYWISTRKYIHYGLFQKDNILTIIISVGMLGSIMLLKYIFSGWAAVFLGCIFYGAGVFLFKIITVSEVKALYKTILDKQSSI